MQVITDAKELEKHTYIKTRNPAVFPKKERLGLAQRMMNEASDLVADLMEANDLLLTDPEERANRLYQTHASSSHFVSSNILLPWRTLLVKRFANNISSTFYQYMIDNHFQFVITIILDSKLNSRIACLNKTIQDFRHFGEVNITLRAIRNGINI